MRLFLLVCLTMLAFAANSVLGRAAIGGGYMDATGFGLWRLVSGAVILALLCRMRGLQIWRAERFLRPSSLWGGAALTLYMAGFTLAYQDLDAGLGALVLFGVVQISMFLWGAVRGSHPTVGQVIGAVVAFSGLAYVIWPQEGVGVPLVAAFLMGLSGLGWGIYSLLGRGAGEPLVATSVNFAWSSVMMLPVLMLAGGGTVLTPYGAALAVVSGAVTSGLGYALWYQVLPRVEPAQAATIQLSVPVLAIVGGTLFLGEPVGLRLVLGSLGVLAGIALVIWLPRRR
ncbi:membrane protein, putative [Roseobacter sp. MED193]|uniref:DMT family transporter n=1 Tax=Roseobacter sp. MED193 TaxID=314262 RepID=UPI000068B755|nr:DMT family transporter [Roseobacter sp. MED193]EAQ47556.1 membrane protein, putative [Roseobacter sp. MED193]